MLTVTTAIAVASATRLTACPAVPPTGGVSAFTHGLYPRGPKNVPPLSYGALDVPGGRLRERHDLHRARTVVGHAGGGRMGGSLGCAWRYPVNGESGRGSPDPATTKDATQVATV